MSATNVEYDLTRLELELKQLETEYTMYFAGRLTKPPWDTRARVDAAVKKLDRAPIKNTATRFRFSTIQSRYAAFVELWERSLRAKEEGRPGPLAGPAEPRAADSDPQARRADRVVHVAVVHDAKDETTLDTLYESLAEARRDVGAPEVPFQKFTNVVTSEVERLRASGSRDVTFRVSIKDGKAHLTARSSKVASEAQKPTGDEEKRTLEKGKRR
ncbi:MAG: MXAN_5187 C-terminal domain-containing protein [Vicinamibacterales bacterium]